MFHTMDYETIKNKIKQKYSNLDVNVKMDFFGIYIEKTYYITEGKIYKKREYITKEEEIPLAIFLLEYKLSSKFREFEERWYE